jgi:hypothetical protein
MTTGRLGRAAVAWGSLCLSAPTQAADPAKQAADLRAKAIANMAALSTLSVEIRHTTRTSSGSANAAIPATAERVHWRKAARRLK